VPISKDREAAIWAKQKSRMAPLVPDEERVEDAGLDDEVDLASGEEHVSE
jgi:hypothetical protein